LQSLFDWHVAPVVVPPASLPPVVSFMPTHSPFVQVWLEGQLALVVQAVGRVGASHLPAVQTWP
jgi:hypothetical protein